MEVFEYQQSFTYESLTGLLKSHSLVLTRYTFKKIAEKYKMTFPLHTRPSSCEGHGRSNRELFRQIGMYLKKDFFASGVATLGVSGRGAETRMTTSTSTGAIYPARIGSRLTGQDWNCSRGRLQHDTWHVSAMRGMYSEQSECSK